jgi:pyruvate dehydrogenase (quinone)
MNDSRRLLGSFNHGSMACASPQGICAQSAFPARQLVTLSGDGGLAMMLGDLLTLSLAQVADQVVVFNNGALAFVELEMKALGIVTYATDLENPNFAALATPSASTAFASSSPTIWNPRCEPLLQSPGRHSLR